MTTIKASERRLERIRSAFRAEDLQRICVQQDFSEYATRYDLPIETAGRFPMWRGAPAERFYWYQDNNAPILAVAHLDHVQWDATCEVVETADGLLAVSGALDDRLGAYVILDLLPQLGIETDILLTTNEEMGDSTAQDFYVDHKQYQWMIEFDRGGKDVVLYQYDTPDTRSLVEEAGARVGMGSYSDIADLEQLGCVGMNWGVGYQDYHSKRSHAWLEDTFDMVGKFMRFHDANIGTHLPFEAPDYGKTPVEGEEGYDWLTDEPCPVCHSECLDKWGTCWSCGFDLDTPGAPEDRRVNTVILNDLLGG